MCVCDCVFRKVGVGWRGGIGLLLMFVTKNTMLEKYYNLFRVRARYRVIMYIIIYTSLYVMMYTAGNK